MSTIIYESTPSAVFSYLKSFAYPSANAQNQGQLNSEENIRWIMLRLTRRSFTLTKEDFWVTRTGDYELTIASGDANIEGYHFKCEIDTILDLTSEDFLNQSLQALLDEATTEEDAFTLYIKFKKNIDASGHLLSYSTDTTTGKPTNFQGFEIVLTNVKPEPTEFYLASLEVYKYNGKPYIKSVTNNMYKCMFVNSTNIFADDDALGETDRTLNNLIFYLIRKIMGEGIDGDIITYGDDNRTTTNVILSKKNSNSYLRLYFNAETKIGGLGFINSLGNLVATNPKNDIDILEFDLENNKFQIFPLELTLGVPSGTEGILSGEVKVGNMNVTQSLNVIGSYNSTNGSINLTNGNIVAKNGTISASKVFGAVWS